MKHGSGMRFFAEFEVDPTQGMIVNGHVPSKLEEG